MVLSIALDQTPRQTTLRCLHSQCDTWRMLALTVHWFSSASEAVVAEVDAKAMAALVLPMYSAARVHLGLLLSPRIGAWLLHWAYHLRERFLGSHLCLC